MFGKNKEPQPTEQKSKSYNIKQYDDPTDSISSSSINKAEWFLKHKLGLQKWVIIVLVSINAVLIVYSLYGWGRYFFFDYTRLDNSLVKMTSPVIRYQNLQPQTMQVRNVQVFSVGQGRYDFMVDVINPNPSWRADVTYKFLFAGGETQEATQTVFPGDGQVLPLFGVGAPGFPINLQAQITNISWERIDAHAIPKPVAFLQTRVQVDVDNVEFTPANPTDGVVSHQISFDVTNSSVYGYWAPVFDAILLNNQQAVGIARFELEAFRPATTQQVILNSLAPSLRVTDVRLVPRIDVFDETAYIPPGQ